MVVETTTKTTDYYPQPQPVNKEGEREYLRRELQRISKELNNLAEAVKEIQTIFANGELVWTIPDP